MAWYAPTKTYYLEGEYLLAEVYRRAEADGQVDLPEWLDSLPWRDAVKRRHARVQLVQVDPHELEGVRVQNIEAAASVHEHLGESGVADDGFHDEQVQP